MKNIVFIVTVTVLVTGILTSCRTSTPSRPESGWVRGTNVEAMLLEVKPMEVKSMELNIKSAAGQSPVLLKLEPSQPLTVKTDPLEIKPVSVEPVEFKPLLINTTGTVSVKLETNLTIGLHATLAPIHIEVTNVVVNVNLSNALNASALLPSGPLITPMPIVICCPTNEGSKGKRDPDAGAPAPPTIQKGPQWWIPFLCILAGGPLGRWLVRNLGLLNQQDEQGDAWTRLRDWLEIHFKGDVPPEIGQWFSRPDGELREKDFNELLRVLAKNIASESRPSGPFPKPLEGLLIELQQTLKRGGKAWDQEEPRSGRIVPIAKDLTAGLVAAALTPVFLRLVSSNLLAAATYDWFSIATFFGLCLLAGMLGVEFIKASVRIFRWLIRVTEQKITQQYDGEPKS